MKALAYSFKEGVGWEVLVDFLKKNSEGEPIIQLIVFGLQQGRKTRNGDPIFYQENEVKLFGFVKVENVRVYIPKMENLYVDNPYVRRRNHEGDYGIVGQIHSTNPNGTPRFQRLPSKAMEFPKNYIWTKDGFIPQLVLNLMVERGKTDAKAA